MKEMFQPLFLRTDELPELPRGWQAAKVDDIADLLKPGKLYDENTVSEIGDVPVVNQSANDFHGFHSEEPGVIASDEQPVSTFANHTCAMRLMKRPFSCIQNIFPRTGKPGVCDTAFFYYSTLGRVRLSGYKGHHPIYRDAWIPLPPLPTQFRIAGILSTYDDLIENNRLRMALLETAARLLYQEWFVRLRFPGHEHARVTNGIPAGWRKVTLGSIAIKIGSGATPRGGEASYPSDGITLIRSLNVYDDQFEDAGLAFISEEQASALDNVTVQSRDILLNITGASVARCCMAPDRHLPSRVNQHVMIIRVAPAEADPFLVHAAINSDERKRQLLSYAQKGSTREALTKEMISDFEITLPTQPLMRQFGEIARTCFLQRENLALQIQKLRAARDLLLPRLMSGEVPI